MSATVRPSLRDLRLAVIRHPTNKLVGYFRVSLRDKDSAAVGYGIWWDPVECRKTIRKLSFQKEEQE
jgi:hypothetical protein